MSSSRIYRNGFTETDDIVTTALWNGDTIRKRKLNNDNIERKMVPKIHVEINGEDGESLDCNGPEWQETAHLIKYRQQEDLNISRKTLMTRVFSNETFTGNEKGKILRDDGEASCSSYDREPLLPALSDPEEDDDEFRTKVIDESAKQEEKSFSIALQVLFPFLIAGFGTVSAGLLLDVVQVSVGGGVYRIAPALPIDGNQSSVNQSIYRYQSMAVIDLSIIKQFCSQGSSMDVYFIKSMESATYIIFICIRYYNNCNSISIYNHKISRHQLIINYRYQSIN